MIIGMDFGTTHSGMAYFDGRTLQSVPLNLHNKVERVTPTVLYVMNEQKVWFGREAMNSYFEQNLGRPAKMERIWIGEIEMTFAEIGTIRHDVHVWVDVLSPGRLFISFKSDLSDSAYSGTAIGRFFYTLEDITALYLTLAKTRAERHFGQKVDEVVLGRPVRFAEDAQDDALAQERLLDAALSAGYKKVYFEYEPIAAAYYYNTLLDSPQNVLIFDFGGGTLDLTVMHLGEQAGPQVLATGGVPIAGNVFDQRIVRAKLPKHFGEGSTYRSMEKQLPIPSHIYDSFSDWRTILTLQAPEMMHLLRSIATTAQHRQKIEALISLVSSNYSMKMFDVVERVKRQLSQRTEAVIRLGGDGFAIEEPISRREFERIIRPEYRIIEAHVDETVQRSGLRPEQIDVVLRTGGSSQIPIFQRMLDHKFGEEKVRALDTFGSVTSGLGIIAAGIEAGTIKKECYTKSRRIEGVTDAENRAVPLVNLEMLQRQIAQQEGMLESRSDQVALVALTKNYELFFEAFAVEALQKAARAMEPISVEKLALPTDVGIQCVVMARMDEPLLLATSSYRLLLITVRELLNYRAAKVSLRDVRGLQPNEQLCTLSHWREMAERDLLVIVSTQGHLRTFGMGQLRSRIEGAVPPTIGWSQVGWPRHIFGTDRGRDLLLTNSKGQGVVVGSGSVPRAGMRALPKRKGDDLIGAFSLQEAVVIEVVSSVGYAANWRIGLEDLSQILSKPRALLARRRGEICYVGNQPTNSRLWLVTSKRLLPLSTSSPAREERAEGKLPLQMQQIAGLQRGEAVLSALNLTYL